MATPQQQRAVDPFSSYESDNVNRLTRILTAGEDKIARDADISPSQDGATIIKISDGVCVKDDVVIQIKDFSGLTGEQSIDITDPTNYVDGTLTSGPYVQKTYLILNYLYVKTPSPNIAQIQILEDLTAYDRDIHMFLGVVNFSSSAVISSILLEDTSPLGSYPAEYYDGSGYIVRPILGLDEVYTDTQARAADAFNPITNHLAAAPADYGKYIRANPGTGAIELTTVVPGASSADREDYVSVTGPNNDGLTFTLTSFVYTPGSDELLVYSDGLLKYITTDYLEIGPSTILFNSIRASGERVSIVKYK